MLEGDFVWKNARADEKNAPKGQEARLAPSPGAEKGLGASVDRRCYGKCGQVVTVMHTKSQPNLPQG